MTQNGMIALTAEIVAAHVARNQVAIGDLPDIISQIHAALKGTGRDFKSETVLEKPVPVVSVKKSVTPDYIICLEDGRKLKMLKRHLMAAYGLTPDAYRERWGLSPDYPMVAPNYAEKRSGLARKIGLGTSGKSGRRKKDKKQPGQS